MPQNDKNKFGIHERLSQLAKSWENANCKEKNLISDDWQLLVARCWIFSEGAKKDGVSPLVQEFVNACFFAKDESWLDNYLMKRDYCGWCDETYRLENLSVCTECKMTYCYKCAAKLENHPNGNKKCFFDDGEVVG